MIRYRDGQLVRITRYQMLLLSTTDNVVGIADASGNFLELPFQMIISGPCDTRISQPLAGTLRSEYRWQAHLLARTLVVAASIGLASCGTLSDSGQTTLTSAADTSFEAPAAVSPVDRSIASDIVQIAQQIFTPFNTTLQFSNNDDPLLQYFITEFSNEGYGIQRVSADQGSNFFSYTRTEDRTADGKLLIRFASSIGAVDIGRDYTVPRTNTISPASPFKLSGTRVPVNVTDTANGRVQVTSADNSTAVYVASLNLDEQAPPVISLITDDLVSRIANESTRQSSLQALNSSRLEINNLFYADQSNFTSVLDNYEQVDRQIVVFGDDSMILGETNKMLLEQLVQRRLSPDDLISLVGCSNGPTALEMGNEGLALGRAERVTQALLSHGVARDRILDEGCWAPVSAGEKFPSRGVVLELWRKAS